MTTKSPTFNKIKLFLIEYADPIQKEATNLHKIYLGEKSLRVEFIAKYQNHHIATVQEIGRHFLDEDKSKGVKLFNEFGEKLGTEAVQDGLTIEEAIDGTIFLKQSIWTALKKKKLLSDLSSEDFYTINNTIGTFIDTFASKIAFTYHKESQHIEEHLKYLAEASKILSSSLDYKTTLNTIASLAVPKIADWCTVDVLELPNDIQQVAVAHKDPKKVKWAIELRKKQPIDMESPTGIPNILRTGKSELYPLISDEMLVSNAKDEEELRLLRSLKFRSAMIVPLFSQTKPIGAITFVTTDSSRHYHQADLFMAEELATRASVAIENARLYKGSQDAITVRDEFISVASHELKTPVTSVKMFTQVLKKHSEQIGDTKAVSHLTKMDKQLNKLTELIYDLLNISKIQAGRMEFKEQVFDFDKAIHEVVDVLQQSSDKHKLVIKGKTGKKVCGDEERIGQVVNNLISNAIKYSPKADRVLITLTATNGMVGLSVEDFGIGMSSEHLGKIFERFYRVYDTTDKTFPGLGIGLYIASEIVNRHKGTFKVVSMQGKGSKFCFSLPVYMEKPSE